MQLPIITSQRLHLFQIESRDAKFIFELMTSPKWIMNIGDRGINSIQDAITYVHQNFQKSYEVNGFGLYKIQLKETGQNIGICGFIKRSFLDAPDVGFALLPEHEKQGFAKEAAAATLQFGFDNLRFEKVYAITLPSNLASINLLTKLGFTKKMDVHQNGSDLYTFELISNCLLD
jgi:RimJ/RimL family protein N-acetyltransferase